MLKKVNDYFDGLMNSLHSWFPKTPVFTSPGFCSIYLTLQKISLAYITPNQNKKNELQFCRTFPHHSFSNLKSILGDVISEFNLKSVPCSWVLNPQHYQLFLQDELPVTPEEFQAAIRWKIKDLLSFPIEDAVIDAFPMPTYKTHDPHKMIMVAVAQQSYLKKRVDQITQSGLALTTIDIPELALRNITALYEKDEKSTALIYIHEKKTQLLISREKSLYFTRQMDFGVEDIGLVTEEANPTLDQLTLEIQRSFDYFYSQWRIPLPNRLLLSTLKISPLQYATYLSNRLSLQVQPLNVFEYINSKIDLSLEEQAKFLPVIGGALRSEIKKK